MKEILVIGAGRSAVTLIDYLLKESLNQNLYYSQLYEKNLIKKNQNTQKLIDNIDNKILKIKNTKNDIFIKCF